MQVGEEIMDGRVKPGDDDGGLSLFHREDIPW
jgi:hypothetical protein